MVQLLMPALRKPFTFAMSASTKCSKYIAHGSTDKEECVSSCMNIITIKECTIAQGHIKPSADSVCGRMITDHPVMNVTRQAPEGSTYRDESGSDNSASTLRVVSTSTNQLSNFCTQNQTFVIGGFVLLGLALLIGVTTCATACNHCRNMNYKRHAPA